MILYISVPRKLGGYMSLKDYSWRSGWIVWERLWRFPTVCGRTKTNILCTDDLPGLQRVDPPSCKAVMQHAIAPRLPRTIWWQKLHHLVAELVIRLCGNPSCHEIIIWEDIVISLWQNQDLNNVLYGVGKFWAAVKVKDPPLWRTIFAVFLLFWHQPFIHHRAYPEKGDKTESPDSCHFQRYHDPHHLVVSCWWSGLNENTRWVALLAASGATTFQGKIFIS